MTVDVLPTTRRGGGGRDRADRPVRTLEAVVLAGGRGVRLRPYTTLLPKPLVPIGEDHSVLEVVLRRLAAQGFSRAWLSVGHLGRIVRAYAGDGSQWGIDVRYLDEDEALGTLGPVLAARRSLPEHFLVLNGDILTDVDFAAVLRTHVDSGAHLTVTVCERQHQVDFGVLETAGSLVTGFMEKPVLRYTVSMGVYGVSQSALRRYPAGGAIGFDALVKDLIASPTPPATYRHDGYWLDIGRPDDYEQANRDFAAMAGRLLGS